MNKLLGFILILTISMATSCDEENLVISVCDGCDSAYPYTNSGAKSCYQTKLECEDVTGLPCINCF